jgi:2-iminoacetate synthase ThiH
MNRTPNEDYVELPDGRIAFSAAFHLKRGYCCGSGCRYCPFDYERVSEPRRAVLRSEQAARIAAEKDAAMNNDAAA